MKQYAVMNYITGREIRYLRQKLELTQAQFAQLVNVSQKTVERWESEKSAGNEITGPIVTLLKILTEQPRIAEDLLIPPKKYPLRLYYMFRQEICSVIDVNERTRQLTVCNFSKKPFKCAFGTAEYPTFEQYEAFLESRCFPRTRDKMKLALRELDLPFYDPMMIIEKTQGRMAEDEFWIMIER